MFLLARIKKTEDVAIPTSRATIEAALFLALRLGAEKMMIVNIQTCELVSGEEEYGAALDRGDTEAEVMTFDPESTAITSLALMNDRPDGEEIPKEYDFLDPYIFERDKPHLKHLPYADDAEFEGTSESYRKFGRIKPIFYIQFERDGCIVRACLDGWKYLLYARANGIEKVYACKLSVGNNDDLLSIMFQLQRSNHDALMALYNMIMALWPKYFKGSGYRSDIREDELDIPTIGPDGKKLSIYQRIGLELNLSGNKVKFLRKVGTVNPLHFERIEISRFTLYAAYMECVKEQRGELQPVPAERPATYISTATPLPTFSEPSTTGNAEVAVSYTPTETSQDNVRNDAFPAGSQDEPACDGNHSHAPVMVSGIVLPASEDMPDHIVVKAICPYCKKEILIKINKNQLP